MKKTVFILMACFLMQITYAQQSPAVSTIDARASQNMQNKRTKKFQNKKRYSSVVNSHQAKAAKKSQAKANNGKG
jgi:hypothetical protein